MTSKLQENYSWPQMVIVDDISHFITGYSLENLRSQAQQVLRNELAYCWCIEHKPTNALLL